MRFSLGAIMFIIGLCMISWGGFRYSCDKKLDVFIISILITIIGFYVLNG